MFSTHTKDFPAFKVLATRLPEGWLPFSADKFQQADINQLKIGSDVYIMPERHETVVTVGKLAAVVDIPEFSGYIVACKTIKGDYKLHDVPAERLYVRVKPTTRQLGGMTVAMPETEPLPLNELYYVPDFAEGTCNYNCYIWENSEQNHRHLAQGLVYLNKQAASKVTRALIAVMHQ